MAIAALPSVWVLIVASLLLRSTVSAIKFRVGGEKGWTEPNGDAAENYNHWASHNRFRVGDSLYFKYENDSLLEVTKEDYKKCYTANPLRKFASGITTVALDRSGLFFFISGEPGHCEAGQRLIVRVGSRPDPRGVTASPAPAPYTGPVVVSSAARAPAGAVAVALAVALCFFMLH
ncbi:mavicyanin-like [Zingiber officinale]|uniref:mavicyanin-like n=1 Tax=Zingiber officinale TaxID=94328 RepID=UPI001C4A8624|nr:mavicyanin-like [Zingiber officinale]